MDICGGTQGHLNIVEVLADVPANDAHYHIMTPLCNKLKNVTKIVNGGLFLENRNGPTGLGEGEYVTVNPGGSASGSSSVKAYDSESKTIAGAVGSLFRDIWSSLCTFFENHVKYRNDVTVLYSFRKYEDYNSNYNSYSNNSDQNDTDTQNIDHSLVEPPDVNSIKLFSKTPTNMGMQNFSITDIGTSNELLWLGINNGAQINIRENFRVKVYKDSKEIGAYIYKYGGHQSFAVYKNSGSYNMYIGSHGTSKYWDGSKYCYWNKGITLETVNPFNDKKNQQKNVASMGLNVQSEILAMGVDETTGRMVTVSRGKSEAIVWNLNKSDISKSSKVSSFEVTGGGQGGCLYGNYLYLIQGARVREMKIVCYNITTGKLEWSKLLNTSNAMGWDTEPEGIQIYNYNGSNKIFIGTNVGKGIWYFDC